MRLNVPVPVRWSDLDAYGHVNNVDLLRLLEEARIHVLWAPDAAEPDVTAPALLGASPGAGNRGLIARQEIEYLKAVPYFRSPLDVEVWVGRVGGASFQLCYEVYSPTGVQPRVLYARASTTTVMVEARTGSPRRINDSARTAFLPYRGDPIDFSRRS